MGLKSITKTGDIILDMLIRKQVPLRLVELPNKYMQYWGYNTLSLFV